MAIGRTTIKEFRRMIKGYHTGYMKAHGLALIDVAQEAKALAHKNLARNFKTTSEGRLETGRKLTGGLKKGIDVEVHRSPSGLPQASLVVKGVPYAAAQEYGSTHGPRRAKHLWVKVDYKSPFKRLTPREFINLKKQGYHNKVGYSLFKSKKGNLIAAKIRRLKGRDPEIRPLFVLKDQVTIPERPFLRPAAKEAARMYPALFRRYEKDVISKMKSKR